MYIRYQDQLQDAATNYKERRWYEDSYARLESGGNLFSNWYENVYRRRWKQKLVELDYGYDWQKIKDVDLIMKFDDTTRVHLPCALADANWVDLCQQLTIYIPEDLKQDLRWSRYKLFKKQINFQDYLEH